MYVEFITSYFSIVTVSNFYGKIICVFFVMLEFRISVYFEVYFLVKVMIPVLNCG